MGLNYKWLVVEVAFLYFSQLLNRRKWLSWGSEFGLWVTKDTREAIWTFVWTYARSGGCMLLSVVRTYSGGPLDILFANRTAEVRQKYQKYATFWNTSG